MEVMTMHNPTNMHAMRVPSQPCDASVLHMHNDECMQIPIPFRATSISLSRSKDAKVVGGMTQHPHAPRKPKTNNPKSGAKRRETKAGVDVATAHGKGKDSQAWNFKGTARHSRMELGLDG